MTDTEELRGAFEERRITIAEIDRRVQRVLSDNLRAQSETRLMRWRAERRAFEADTAARTT